MAATLALGAASTATATHAGWNDAVTFKAVASAASWGNQPPATPATSVIVPGNTTTDIAGITWDVEDPGAGLGFCAALTIKGSTTTPARWELDADLDKPPFNGLASTSGITVADKVHLSLALSPSNPRIMVITGVGDPSRAWDPKSNNLMLDSSRTLSIKLCLGYNSMVPGLGAPSWYTATIARGSEWTDTRACKVLTVTGKVQDLAANPFLFGWKANFDLTDAKARVGERSVINQVSWSPYPSDGYRFFTTPAWVEPVPDTYNITSGRMTVIRGTQSVSITACVTGY